MIPAPSDREPARAVVVDCLNWYGNAEYERGLLGHSNERSEDCRAKLLAAIAAYATVPAPAPEVETRPADERWSFARTCILAGAELATSDEGDKALDFTATWNALVDAKASELADRASSAPAETTPEPNFEAARKAWDETTAFWPPEWIGTVELTQND